MRVELVEPKNELSIRAKLSRQYTHIAAIWSGLLCIALITACASAGVIIDRVPTVPPASSQAGPGPTQTPAAALSDVEVCPSLAAGEGRLVQAFPSGQWMRQGNTQAMGLAEANALGVGRVFDRLAPPSPSEQTIFYGAIPWTPGLTLAAVVRPTVARPGGPVLAFTSAAQPWTPGIPTWGWLGDQGSAGRGNWTPLEVTNSTSYPELADNVDTLLLVTLRPEGFYGLVANDALEAPGRARLAYVGSEGSAPQIFANVSAGTGIAVLRGLCVYVLNWSDEVLAGVLDRFDRPDAADLGRPDKGPSSWQAQGGTWDIRNSELECGQSGLVTTDIGHADGWIEAAGRTPQVGPFSAGLVFRMSDNRNYWVWSASDSQVSLEKVVEGVPTMVYQTSSIQLQPNTSFTLRARLEGDAIYLWLNGLNALFSTEPLHDAFNQVAARAGLSCGTAGMRFQSFTTWPSSVALPNAIAKLAPPVPIGATPIFTDTFSGLDGTHLATRQIGNYVWMELGGAWVLQNNTAVLRSPNGSALAVINARMWDVAAEAEIILPSVPQVGDTPGISVRAADLGNRLWARILWQQGSPEIELWQAIDGQSTFLNAVNITQYLHLDEPHRLRLVAVGAELAAFLDGRLVVQATISAEALVRLSSMQVGISRDDIPGQPVFRSFWAGPASLKIPSAP